MNKKILRILDWITVSVGIIAAVALLYGIVILIK